MNGRAEAGVLPAGAAFDSVVSGAHDRPANAYLLVGSPDATVAAARRLATVLCRLEPDSAEAAALGRGTHPDCIEIEPAGVGVYLAAQLDGEIRPVVARAPFEAERKTVVLHDAELLGDTLAAALLKTLEEPPPSTSFVLCCADEAAVLETITSRCVVVTIPPVPDAVAGVLLSAEFDDADPDECARLVRACGGITGARAVLGDPAVAQRRLRWLTLPGRAVAGEPVAPLAIEVADDLAAAHEALAVRDAAERAELEAFLGEKSGGKGGRGVRGRQGALNALEERQKRRGRNAANALAREFLGLTAAWLRDVEAARAGVDVLHVEVRGDVQQAAGVLSTAQVLRGLDAVVTASEALDRNANVDLAIEDVLVVLAGLADRR